MTPRGMRSLHALARALGVDTHYVDGLGNSVKVDPETLVRVCGALGAAVERPADASEALRAHRAAEAAAHLPPVLLAWDGVLEPVSVGRRQVEQAELRLESGDRASLEIRRSKLAVRDPVPFGYHTLTVDVGGRMETSTIIAAPTQAWRRPGSHHGWGVAAQLAALRTARSRSVADLRDLEVACRWVGQLGGELVLLLPLHPTFNREPAEPSPYSPVSRLFWSELMLDLGQAHSPQPSVTSLDVTVAEAEVRHALADVPAPPAASVEAELRRYARFRGAQARLGRNWSAWPTRARAGVLEPPQVDADEERFHLVAQSMVRRQLSDLRRRLASDGIRLGLDLAVGVHPHGYDPWSRASLFAEGMSVGAPPDPGFPSGQDWGFRPTLPAASRREGHRYFADALARQTELAGVLRVDHVLAWRRLYWIPQGFEQQQGTYVAYPADELFAVLTLESNRHQCEVVGENLGTVPPQIGEALERHRIWGVYLPQFQVVDDTEIRPPTARDVAQVGTHDTPPFAGWLVGSDIEERVRYGLLAERAKHRARRERHEVVQRLARALDADTEDMHDFLAKLLEWLGRSDCPLVIPWLEELWLEERGVNLPGTSSSQRPNWQRPMGRLLNDLVVDPGVQELLKRLQRARDDVS